MHPLFRSQKRVQQERELRQQQEEQGMYSQSSLESYESDSDSYEPDSSYVEGTQYETDSASGVDRSDEDEDDEGSYDEEYGSRSMSASEDDDGWGTGSSASRSDYDGNGRDASNSFDNGSSQHSNEDDEEDDSEFWNRYGDDDDDDDDDLHGRPDRPTGKWSAPLSRGSTDDDDESSNDGFDDEFGLAFPTIAGDTISSSKPPKRKKKKSWGVGSFGRCCSFDFDCFKSRKCMYISIAILLVIIAVAVVVPLYLSKNDDPSATPSSAPTTAIPTPQPSPSLPQEQITLSFYGLIPDGKIDGVELEELEEDISQALDLLAFEVWEEINDNQNETLVNTTAATNTTVIPQLNGTNQNIQEAGNPAPNATRKLEPASPSVLSSNIIVVQIECPNSPSIDEDDVCIEVESNFTIESNDGNTTMSTFGDSMESAISEGMLQEAYIEVGGNQTSLFYVGTAPPNVATTIPVATFAPSGGETSAPALASNSTNAPSPTAAPTFPGAPTSEPDNDGSCVDTLPSCDEWANREISECDRNPGYMAITCPKACDMCPTETAAPSMNITTSIPTSAPTTLIPATNAPTVSSDSSSPPTTPSSCTDGREQCSVWAEGGECEKNPAFMNPNCQKSCGLCDSEGDGGGNSSGGGGEEGNADCVDDRDQCSFWAENGECENNPVFMTQSCKLSCGVCEGGTGGNEIEPCEDTNASCETWAEAGECSNNPVYMEKNCPKSCNKCSSI